MNRASILRVLKVLALSIGASEVCAFVFVVMLHFSLPPSDSAYGIPPLELFKDPFVSTSAIYGAALSGLFSFPFAYFAVRNRRLLTSALFVFAAVVAEILLVTPFANWWGFLGSFPALAVALLLVGFSQWQLFAPTHGRPGGGK